ncbi:MAG: PQQ-dependent dehydrogenase, methanol/ethanol family [Bryobacteraceae bacterium]
MTLRIVFVLLATAALALAQHPRVSEGKQQFVKHCSACHGDNAKGGRASDLTSGNWKHGSTDEDLFRNIMNGIPGTQMPAFKIPSDAARTIISFLRSIGAPEEAVNGNAARGQEIFYGAGGCSQCHMFGGRGGLQGPDLSRKLRSGDVRKAMMKPWKEYTFKSLTKNIKGVKKSDDTFSIHLMDSSGNLHLLSKRDGLVTDKAMPHAGLDAASQEDVVTFLVKTDPASIDRGPWKPAADLNVTFERLVNAEKEPHNWLTYWGNYRGTHFSPLKQINAQNVTKLKADWTFQFGGNTVQTTPIVVDGLMFVTGPLNNAAALDARTGKPIWRYSRQLPNVASHCTVMTNRGFAMLGDRLFLATLDTHLVSMDAKSGNVIWDVEVDDYKKGYSITHAPLAINGMIIVGATAGECGLTGFVDAYDAATGKRLWRTHATAQPGDPNRKTWEPEVSAGFGGSPTWMTGTYDVDTDTVFWTTGNPGPDYDGTVRKGDNLYSCSVLALDAKTGRMKWWFQFTPHDVHDWDGNQVPILIDAKVRGQQRKLLVTANRNAFYYVLDRVTGEFISGRPFAKQTWARGLDDKGRPLLLPDTTPTPQGNYVCPDAAGAANWGAPSFDPSTGFFLVSVREACATYFSVTKDPVAGEGYTGGGQEIDEKQGTPGFVRALDATTGAKKWDFPIHTGSSATGVLGTAGGLAFASSHDGNLIALNSKDGSYLWHYYTGANIITSPMSYAINGKQYVAIAAQSALFVFSLP